MAQDESWLAWGTQRLTWLGRGVTGGGLVLFAILWGGCAIRAARHPWQVTGFVVASVLVLGVGGWHLGTFARADYTPSNFLRNPVAADAASLAAGQRVYQTHCLQCHGLGGQGHGPLASKLPQPPRAFLVSLTATHSDGDVFHWIQHGRPGTAMPAFAGHVSPDDTWHVVHYLRQMRREP